MDKLTVQKTEWDLTSLLQNDNDTKIEKEKKLIEKKTTAFVNKWRSREDYLTDPAVLKEALDELEEWQRYPATEGDQVYYFGLRTAQDENNPDLKAKENKAVEFAKKFYNETQFFLLKVTLIPKEIQNKFLDFEGLKPYKHFLERQFASAKYQLSEAEEKILLLKSAPSYTNWTQMTSGFLSKEERKVINKKGKQEIKNYSELYGLINDKNKKIRDSAAKALNEILGKHLEVAEAEINSIFQNKKIDDELRGMERPDTSRHLADDMESEAVDKLVESVSERNDISKRYYKLKAKLMGVDKLEYHERNVELGKVDKKYPFDEAVNLVNKVMWELDPKFSEILEMYVKNGQLDVFPRKGKRSGAFCAGNLLTQPSYILLNHNDRLNDVLTLAHELGHGINNELIREKQNALNYGTPTSTAEVASTFMEDFVLQEILKTADDEVKLSLMMTKLNDDVSSITRQIACYKLETELHKKFREKGYLSKEEIGQIFKDNMQAYMGDAVEQSPGSENWWVLWSHIRYFFYVYSYSSGLLISKSLQNSVKSDHSFIEKVKDFLSAGTSDSPKNIFAKMGVDITDKKFWDKGLNEMDALLIETEKLALKLKKF